MSKRRCKTARQSSGFIKPRVMISGYYGFNNLGDELILKVLTDELKSLGVDITVLSQNPAETASRYGVDAIRRTSIVDIIDAMTHCDLFISGGGGLFQDATGPMSAIYYGGLIHLARFFDVPVCFWAQGVGPLTTPWPRTITASALQKCQKILVRDEKSANLVQELSGLCPAITADPVWLLKMPKPGRKTQASEKTWRIGISLRTWPTLTVESLQKLAVCLKHLAASMQRPAEFVLLPFQEEEDRQPLQDFSDALNDIQAGTVVMTTPDKALEELGNCDVLFGMRFHSLILGLLANVPVYGIIYDPKVASLIENFHLQGSSIENLASIEGNEVQAYLETYPPIDLTPFQKQARLNFEALQHLLEIPEAELVL